MTDSIAEERERLWVRPVRSPAEMLGAFYVEVGGWREVDEFAGRVRGLVAAGVETVQRGDFASDELSEDVLPEWVRGDNLTTMRSNARRRYVLHRGEEEWTAQDLLFSFEPTRRQWKWWDVTRLGGNMLQVWVDCLGEPVFACDELRWVLYLSGARTVVGPVLSSSEGWSRQESVAVHGASRGLIPDAGV